MMRNVLCSSMLLVALVSRGFYLSATPFDQDQGIEPGCAAIRGSVVDQIGAPVSGVKVYAMVADRPPRARSADFSSTTDEKGKFFLGCIEPGRTGLYTAKEDDYYPDTLVTPFIDSKSFTVVDAVNQQLLSNVIVRLPSKAGRLRVQVLDGNSHRPINLASLTICRSDDSLNLPGPKCRSIGNLPGNGFARLLPAIDYVITASAPGYKDSTTEIKVKAAATKLIDINLALSH